jgi:hypothetical protein
MNHQTFFLNDFDTLSYRILCEKINHVRKFDDNVTLNQSLIDLTNKGVKTYFFQAPLYAKYEKIYLTKEQRLEWYKIKNTYQDSLAIPCFIPSIHLNDSDYFDGGHLNYKGARKFQPWLINLLDSLL